MMGGGGGELLTKVFKASGISRVHVFSIILTLMNHWILIEQRQCRSDDLIFPSSLFSYFLL